MLDPLHLTLAFGPVAIYLLSLGMLNLARRPFLVSGGRDTAALGVAMTGLMLIGPMSLFFPTAAAVRLGAVVWLLLLLFYGLCLTLVLLLLRPRLVVYNMKADQFRPILADLVQRLDGDARWAGDSVMLPSLGLQLHLDVLPAMRNISLVANGSGQNHGGWRRLEEQLGGALRDVDVERNPRGVSMVSAGMLIIVMITISIAQRPEPVLRAINDSLHWLTVVLQGLFY